MCCGGRECPPLRAGRYARQRTWFTPLTQDCTGMYYWSTCRLPVTRPSRSSSGDKRRRQRRSKCSRHCAVPACAAPVRPLLTRQARGAENSTAGSSATCGMTCMPTSMTLIARRWLRAQATLTAQARHTHRQPQTQPPTLSVLSGRAGQASGVVWCWRVRMRSEHQANSCLWPLPPTSRLLQTRNRAAFTRTCLSLRHGTACVKWARTTRLPDCRAVRSSPPLDCPCRLLAQQTASSARLLANAGHLRASKSMCTGCVYCVIVKAGHDQSITK